jgi:hypothetical protein
VGNLPLKATASNAKLGFGVSNDWRFAEGGLLHEFVELKSVGNPADNFRRFGPATLQKQGIPEKREARFSEVPVHGNVEHEG